MLSGFYHILRNGGQRVIHRIVKKSRTLKALFNFFFVAVNFSVHPDVIYVINRVKFSFDNIILFDSNKEDG